MEHETHTAREALIAESCHRWTLASILSRSAQPVHELAGKALCLVARETLEALDTEGDLRVTGVRQ